MRAKEKIIMSGEGETNGAALGAMFGDMQVRAAGAANQLAEMARGNAEALVASGKLLQGGLKQLGEGALAEGRQNFALLCEDMREMIQAKSPAEALQVQARLAQRNAGMAMGVLLRGPQAMFDVAVQSFEPLTGRMKAGLEVVETLG